MRRQVIAQIKLVRACEYSRELAREGDGRNGLFRDIHHTAAAG
jgi:hypothetical protein